MTEEQHAAYGVGSHAAELEMAKTVQQGLLDVEIPERDDIKIAARCIAAEDVGGDFYTFINYEGRSSSTKEDIPGVITYVDTRDNLFGVAIGDVAGHGISSALVMALSSVIFRKQGKANKSPAKALEMVNDDIHRYINTSPIRYLTAFYCVIDTQSKQLTYSKAGHQPGLLIRSGSNSIEELSTSGIFLGMFEDEDFEEKTIQLASGDRVVLFTDGITESANNDKEQFGDERLHNALIDSMTLSIDDSVDTVLNNVAEFSGSKLGRDDRTIVMIEIV
jgi:sigma-B regulation protein RsbU (phosphoserine phosphatase)